MSINKLSNLSLASLKSYLSEVGAARQGFAQSPVHEWQSRIRMKHSVDSSTATENGQFTAKKPMSGKSDSGFFSGKLNCLVSWKRDLILQHINLNDRCLFFLCDTFPCWHQKVKQILYFDKKNKNNICNFYIFLQTCQHYFFFFFSATHYYVDNKM